MKKISEFFCENFHFLVLKFSVYLNRHVFVMAHNSLQIRISLYLHEYKISTDKIRTIISCQIRKFLRISVKGK